MASIRLIGFLLVSTALLLAPRTASAQCCGDCAGDGQVSVSDLVTAVNNALNGCGGGPTPTPTPPLASCPIDFGDDNTRPGTPDCYYRGHWNDSCGADDLEALWRSDGDIVVISLLGFPSGLFLGAEARGGSSADLIGWYTEPDASDLEEAAGDVTLADGATLTIVPVQALFDIESCPFRQYEGSLFAVDTPSAARTAARAALRNPEAIERLRGAAAARHKRPDFSRRKRRKIRVD